MRPALYGPAFDSALDDLPCELLGIQRDTRRRFFGRRCFISGRGGVRAIERLIIPSQCLPVSTRSMSGLIDAWKSLRGTSPLQSRVGPTENTEDAGTLAYLEDTARQAGPSRPPFIDI